jgi:hypothetical protein
MASNTERGIALWVIILILIVGLGFVFGYLLLGG